MNESTEESSKQDSKGTTCFGPILPTDESSKQDSEGMCIGPILPKDESSKHDSEKSFIGQEMAVPTNSNKEMLSEPFSKNLEMDVDANTSDLPTQSYIMIELDFNENTPDELHQICEKNLNLSGDDNSKILETQIYPEQLTELHAAQNDDIDAKPTTNSYLMDKQKIELCRYSWPSTIEKQHYTRGCLWSPDGTCILTVVNLDGMHIFDLPNSLYQNEYISNDRPVDILETAIHVKESGTVYDLCWYPFMKSTMPETCCWLSTKQHGPLQLWDAFSGELRATYRGYNTVDEVEAAYSVTFSADAEKVIGGYRKTLKVFNTNVPGRTYNEIPVNQPIVCFATNAVHQEMIATGSWNTTINMYDLRNPKLGALCTLAHHKGGITHIQFSPNGMSLFSGARKDSMLLEWDMRNFSKPVSTFKRLVGTNQRIYFDITTDGHCLVSGDTDGIIHVWNLHTKGYEYQYQLHSDCCNGISFHHSRPIIATSSGQYHFPDEPILNDEKPFENALTFWWTGTISSGDS